MNLDKQTKTVTDITYRDFYFKDMKNIESICRYAIDMYKSQDISLPKDIRMNMIYQETKKKYNLHYDEDIEIDKDTELGQLVYILSCINIGEQKYRVFGGDMICYIAMFFRENFNQENIWLENKFSKSNNYIVPSIPYKNL